jgi:hypothetical protein
MPESEAIRKSKMKYKAAKRKQLVLEYSDQEYLRIKEYCLALSVPMASWVKTLIKNAMDDQNQD